MSSDCLQRLAALEALVEQRLAVVEAINEERYTASQNALKLASDAIDRRLAAMDEFRDQLREQAATFIRREEHTLIENEISRISLAVQNLATKGELNQGLMREADRDRINEAKIATLTTQFWIGGTGIVVIIGVVQVIANYLFRH